LQYKHFDSGKLQRSFVMKKDKFFVHGMLAIALVFVFGLVLAGCATDGGDDPYTGPNSETLNSLLSTAPSEIQRWDEGNENERDVTVYSFNLEIKDELIQAVKDAGFYQAWSGEYTRDWDLARGVLRWCVPSNTEKWDCEIQFSAIGKTTVHTYGFRLIPNSDGRPKTIKITGYSPQGGIEDVGEMTIFSESTDPAGWPPAAKAYPPVINGQIITCSLMANQEHWTGTGKFFILIECYPAKDPSKDGSKYIYSVDGTNPTPVDIKNEVTTLEWSKFIWLTDYTAG
jgi:hypothetical protein